MKTKLECPTCGKKFVGKIGLGVHANTCPGRPEGEIHAAATPKRKKVNRNGTPPPLPNVVPAKVKFCPECGCHLEKHYIASSL